MAPMATIAATVAIAAMSIRAETIAIAAIIKYIFFILLV
jgi:hypothetical protein